VTYPGGGDGGTKTHVTARGGEFVTVFVYQRDHRVDIVPAWTLAALVRLPAPLDEAAFLELGEMVVNPLCGVEGRVLGRDQQSQTVGVVVLRVVFREGVEQLSAIRVREGVQHDPRVLDSAICENSRTNNTYSSSLSGKRKEFSPADTPI
jgi:hypothetical protein